MLGLTKPKDYIKCSAIQDTTYTDGYKFNIFPPLNSSTYINPRLLNSLVQWELLDCENDQLSIFLEPIKDKEQFKSAIIDTPSIPSTPINHQSTPINSASKKSNKNKKSNKKSKKRKKLLKSKDKALGDEFAKHGLITSSTIIKSQIKRDRIQAKDVENTCGDRVIDGDVMLGRLSHIADIYTMFAVLQQDHSTAKTMERALLRLADNAYAVQIVGSNMSDNELSINNSQVSDIKTKNSPFQYSVGEICAAFSMDREKWYRVKITSVLENNENDGHGEGIHTVEILLKMSRDLSLHIYLRNIIYKFNSCKILIPYLHVTNKYKNTEFNKKIFEFNKKIKQNSILEYLVLNFIINTYLNNIII